MYVTPFFVMLAYDWVWAKYTLATANKYAILAGSWASAMPFFIAFFSRSYVEDWKTAIPAACGAFVGTYIGIKYGNKQG